MSGALLRLDETQFFQKFLPCYIIS